MKLLVTGGAGFIGSHFIRQWLAAHPADEIVTLDALTYAGSRQRLADAPGHQFLFGDICDRQAVDQALAGCETVIHFAAETHVDRSITDAAAFLRTNVEGTHALLQAAREAGIGRFIHVSTDEVYGPVLSGAVDETARLAPTSPYAASKAAGDLLAQAHVATFGMPVVIVRPTNIYGPWQLPEKLIPLCITNAMDGVPIPVYGDGRQRRAWLFVEDACGAIAALAERGEPGGIYNLAGGEEQENLPTIEQILQRLGAPPSLITFVADRPGHDRRYAMQDDRLRALGWQPQVSFAEGLSRTVSWYHAHEAWWRPLAARLRTDPYHWLKAAAPAAR